MTEKGLRFAAGVGLLLLLLLLPSAAAAQQERSKALGFVDGAGFIDLVGEDGLTVEISLHGALLKALTAWDEDLKKLVGGLESIHAVILELEDDATETRVRKQVRETEKRLTGRGWERLARIREDGSDVVVLVLNSEEEIQGLVVMVLDAGDSTLVFANVAGVVDLAAIEQLGEQFNLPGLKDLVE